MTQAGNRSSQANVGAGLQPTIKWQDVSTGQHQYTYGKAPDGHGVRLHWHGIQHFPDQYAVLEVFTATGWSELDRVHFYPDDPHYKTREEAYARLMAVAEILVPGLNLPD